MKITIVGIGFIGLVNALGFTAKGHSVFALDSDKKKIASLRKCETIIKENKLQDYLDKYGNDIRFTSEFRDAIFGADIVIICNEIPEKEPGVCDLIGYYQTLKECAKHIQKDVTFVIRSTVPVGTCAETKDYLNKLTENKYHIDVVSNPDFCAQGTAMKDMIMPSRIVVGLKTKQAQEAIQELYKNFDCPLLIVSPESAELIKYASNAYLAVKLSYINEIADLCDCVGADIQEVSYGIGLDPRIGAKYLYSGVGFGGPSLPQDTRVLDNMAKENNVSLSVLNAAMHVNDNRPSQIISKIKKVLGENLSDKRFAVLGLSYKGNTDDIRQSPAFKVIDELLKEDSRIIAYDPISTTAFRKKMKSDQHIAYANTLDEALKTCDVAIFLNESEEFKKLTNENFIEYMKKPIVFDGKGILKPNQLKDVMYFAVGKKVRKTKK